MIPVLTLPLRHLRRRPARTVLTALGVAAAIFLFVSVESLGLGLQRALSSGDAARTLVVYRENRYCPQTSFLPERYAGRVAEIDGVESVLPVKVHLSDCRASLDVVAFQGAPVDTLLRTRPIELVAGDLDRFRREPDAALVGRAFANRRGLAPGDRFRFGEITVDVAGIFASDDPVDEGLLLTHLEFLQRAAGVDRLGTVTQLEVKLADAGDGRRVAEEIDRMFATAEAPTSTRPRLEFLEGATAELAELLRFARAFGRICVLVVVVLIANTVLLSVQERGREFGVHLTLGYRGAHLVAMVTVETLLLTLAGAAVGVAAAVVVVSTSHAALAVEGVSVGFALSAGEVARAVGIAVVAAVAAAAVPALRAARTDVHRLFRGA